MRVIPVSVSKSKFLAKKRYRNIRINYLLKTDVALVPCQNETNYTTICSEIHIIETYIRREKMNESFTF